MGSASTTARKSLSFESASRVHTYSSFSRWPGPTGLFTYTDSSYDLGAGAQVSDFNDRRYSGDTRGFPADPPIWESVVAMPRFKGKSLVDVVLHPISLGYGKPASQRGRPMLADATLGKKILDDLIKLSEPFGTKIENRNGVGYVVVK